MSLNSRADRITKNPSRTSPVSLNITIPSCFREAKESYIASKSFNPSSNRVTEKMIRQTPRPRMIQR